jgi:hypothetical protein
MGVGHYLEQRRTESSPRMTSQALLCGRNTGNPFKGEVYTVAL